MAQLPVELRLLGSFQLTLHGKPLSGLVSGKAKALLAYLALEGGMCERSRLAGLLWSDLSEEDARRNLRVEIAKLRHWLEPYLQITHTQVGLNPGNPLWLDVRLFEEQAARLASLPIGQRVASAQAAAEVYRGELLSGFQVRAAPLFEEWLVIRRERLRQVALDTLDALMLAAERQQDWKSGLLAARQSLAIDPWRELSHSQLMLFLARSGDRTAALVQFESARRILTQELGIEPGAALLAVYQQIKSGQLDPTPHSELPAAAGVGIPHNLPAATTAFVGRQSELEQLNGLSADPAVRLVTLTGAGGAGKTRLALEFAWQQTRRAERRFADGIWFVALETISEPDLLPVTLANALGLSLSGAQPPLAQIIRQVQTRRLLLVLDNFEQLSQAAPLLVELLKAAPGLVCVVTARQPLELYEEWVFPVEGMAYPPDAGDPDWQAYPAVQLFIQRARRANLRFAPAENRAWIIRVCQIVDGLPLGIELAAAWALALPCEQIYRLIEQNLALPEVATRNLAPRQRSLRAILQSAWDLLPVEQQQTLRRISVFRGGFNALAAEQVSGAPLRLLAGLAGKSLLRHTPDGRYQLHVLLQAYAAEHLLEPEQTEMRAAHSRYFGGWLQSYAAEIGAPGEAATIEALGAEISNLRQGWQWALAQALVDPRAGMRLLESYLGMLSTFYLRKSWFREGAAVFAAAIQAMHSAGFGDLPPDSRAPLALGAAQVAHSRYCRALGEHAQARQLLQAALSHLAPYPPNPTATDAWHILAQVEQQTGDLAAAEYAYQTSLELARSLGNQSAVASALIGLGVLAKNRSDFDLAASLYHECLDIFTRRGDERGVWTCLINLGNIANVRGDYPQALRLYSQAHENVQRTTDQARQALTLINLGSVARATAAYAEARQYYQDSLRLSEAIGEKRILTASLDGLGKTCLSQRNYAEALDWLRQALARGLESKLVPQALDSLATLGRVRAELGALEAGLAILYFVSEQAATPEHARAEARAHLDVLALQATPAQLEQAQVQARTLTLDSPAQFV